MGSSWQDGGCATLNPHPARELTPSGLPECSALRFLHFKGQDMKDRKTEDGGRSSARRWVTIRVTEREKTRLCVGKMWRSSRAIREADFSRPDVDFSGTGMTSCQVGMPDSGRARPRMGSCKARRRSRLLITLRPWRNDAFSEAAEARNRRGRKSGRRSREKFSTTPSAFKVDLFPLRAEDGHTFRTGRIPSLPVPGLHNVHAVITGGS